MKTMSGLLLALALLWSSFALKTTVQANQKQKKSWTEWSEKDAEKMLSDSPWAKIQKETDTSELFFRPTADPRTAGSRAPNANARLEQEFFSDVPADVPAVAT